MIIGGVRNKIKGFNISSKDVVVDKVKNIYVNHEYKGVFKLSLNDSLTSVQRIDTVEVLGKGIGSDMIMFKDNIIYARRDSVYTKPYNEKTFTLNEELSQLVKKDVYTSGTLVISNGYLWLFNKDHLSKISIEDIDGTYSVEKVFLSKELRNEKVGYENLTVLGSNEYLIGSSYGYTTLNQNKKTVTTNELYINEVKSFKDGEFILFGLTDIPTIPYKDNFLQIHYSSPSYNSLNTVLYQYRVLELNESWSEWAENTSIELKNLSYGDYNFEVRSRINETLSTNTETYSFTIARPYYLTNTAIAIYILLLIALIILLNGFYIWYFKRQKERALLKQQKELELRNLTNEKNLIELRNAKLRGDIEHRNKELAISTMAMIKKNETLNELKEELNNLPKTVESKSLKKMLDKT
nr:triple tyrosine motif-containing protein [Nonlabens ulvanivorans]